MVPGIKLERSVLGFSEDLPETVRDGLLVYKKPEPAEPEWPDVVGAIGVEIEEGTSLEAEDWLGDGDVDNENWIDQFYVVMQFAFDTCAF